VRGGRREGGEGEGVHGQGKAERQGTDLV